MSVRACAVDFALMAGFLAASEAGAFFGDHRPPNGMNGINLNGFASDVMAVEAIILQDGSRLVLK
jgi:hypothetical protein